MWRLQIKTYCLIKDKCHGLSKSGQWRCLRLIILFKGNSVCCYVHGFHPYFYVPAPPNFSEKNLPEFRIALNQAILTDMKNNKDNVGQAVLDVSLESKSSIYGFQVSR